MRTAQFEEKHRKAVKMFEQQHAAVDGIYACMAYIACTHRACIPTTAIAKLL
jgi:histidinol phosphatase-like enzyme